MIPERRKVDRKIFSYYFPVSDAATIQKVGIMTDASLGGFKLDSRDPIPFGQVNQFLLDLGDEITPRTYLVVTGRSKWCRPDPMTPSTYNVGFEITDMAPEEEAIFQHLFERYGSQLTRQ